MENMCLKMKLEAVEQSRYKIDDELEEMRTDQRFLVSERDKLKEDYEEMKRAWEEAQKKLREA